MTTRSLSNHDPLYVNMREFTRNLCIQGVGAVESNEKLREKYGDNSPTLCTVYKWRRDIRGGKGERQANSEDIELSPPEESPKPAKMAKKEVEKYCNACNREMSSRHYYEFHMLKVHDVLLGESKPTIEYLEQMSMMRRRQLIFRCDACFGGELDYDSIEELQQHKLLEHGQHFRMPKWESSPRKTRSPSKDQTVKSPGSSTPSIQQLAKFQQASKMPLRRDKSLPAFSGLRRSARVPKPTSAMIHSLLLAKDHNETAEYHQAEEKPVERAKFLKRVDSLPRGRKMVSFEPPIHQFKLELTELGKKSALKMQLEREEKSTRQPGTRQPNAGTKSGGVGGRKEEDGRFFIRTLGDGRIEAEEPEGVKQQKQKQTSGTNNSGFPPMRRAQQKTRLMSPAALDAAKSLLKLTNFGASPAASTTSDEPINSPAKSTSDGGGGGSIAIVSPTIGQSIGTGADAFKSQSSSMGGGHSSSSVSSVTSPPPSMQTALQQTSKQHVSVPVLALNVAQQQHGTKKVPNILKNGHWGKEKMAEKKLAGLNLQQQQQQKAIKNGAAQNGQEKEEGTGKGGQQVAEKSQPEKTMKQPLSATAAVQTEEQAEQERSFDTAIPSTPAAAATHLTTALASTQQAVIVPQDDSTWFGHSIAAQLRAMQAQTKELVKMRIQQVIFECSTTTFAPVQQVQPVVQQQQVQQARRVTPIVQIPEQQQKAAPAAPAQSETTRTEENGVELEELNGGGGGEKDESHENCEIDVVTVEEESEQQLVNSSGGSLMLIAKAALMGQAK